MTAARTSYSGKCLFWQPGLPIKLCLRCSPYRQLFHLCITVTVWGLSADRGECLTSLSKHPARHLFLKCLIQTAKVCFYQTSASFLINKSERDSRLRFQPPPPPLPPIKNDRTDFVLDSQSCVCNRHSALGGDERDPVPWHALCKWKKDNSILPPTSRLPQTSLWHSVINHYTNSLLTVAFGNRALLIGHLVP